MVVINCGLTIILYSIHIYGKHMCVSISHTLSLALTSLIFSLLTQSFVFLFLFFVMFEKEGKDLHRKRAKGSQGGKSKGTVQYVWKSKGTTVQYIWKSKGTVSMYCVASAVTKQRTH